MGFCGGWPIWSGGFGTRPYNLPRFDFTCTGLGDSVKLLNEVVNMGLIVSWN